MYLLADYILVFSGFYFVLKIYILLSKHTKIHFLSGFRLDNQDPSMHENGRLILVRTNRLCKTFVMISYEDLYDNFYENEKLHYKSLYS